MILKEEILSNDNSSNVSEAGSKNENRSVSVKEIKNKEINCSCCRKKAIAAFEHLEGKSVARCRKLQLNKYQQCRKLWHSMRQTMSSFKFHYNSFNHFYFFEKHSNFFQLFFKLIKHTKWKKRFFQNELIK